jgi:hypothetical protein
MSNKVAVKKLITACEGLSEEEKRSLRRLLDRNIVGTDAMTDNGSLIEISYLKLVVSDNLGE